MTHVGNFDFGTDRPPSAIHYTTRLQPHRSISGKSQAHSILRTLASPPDGKKGELITAFGSLVRFHPKSDITVSEGNAGGRSGGYCSSRSQNHPTCRTVDSQSTVMSGCGVWSAGRSQSPAIGNGSPKVVG
jgi:hypothetical protein